MAKGLFGTVVRTISTEYPLLGDLRSGSHEIRGPIHANQWPDFQAPELYLAYV